MQQDDSWEDVYSESREKDKEEEQEEFLRSAFFEQKDGRLFLMTADGPLRREKICHGKQILSFAEDGALEKIEKTVRRTVRILRLSMERISILLRTAIFTSRKAEAGGKIVWLEMATSFGWTADVRVCGMCAAIRFPIRIRLK